jgi:hypothetical protein
MRETQYWRPLRDASVQPLRRQGHEEPLAEISRRISVAAIALLVLDGANWHNSPQLKLPDNIVLLALPPHSPEGPHGKCLGVFVRQLSQPPCLGRL